MWNHLPVKIYKVFIILALFGLYGCEVQEALIKEKEKFDVEGDYKKVVYFNGISKFEAEAIASHYLLNSVYKSYYNVFSLEIRKDKEAKKYKKYWFVHFSPNAEHDTKSFLVVIDKHDGTILAAEDYVPHIQKGLDWVFRKRNPVIVPPPQE